MIDFMEKYIAYKTLLLNGTVLGITLVDFQSALQITLLLITIAYTLWKWYKNWKK